MLPHRAHDGDGADGAALQAPEHRLDHLLDAQSPPQVQPRCPAHLEVVDVLPRRVVAQLARDAFERLFGLHHRNCRLEVGDVLGLAGTVLGRDHAKPLPARELLRRGHAHGSIEVRVQLGLLPAEVRRIRYVRA